MRILHITDFHIDSPEGEKENLREGFYEEFIDNLFSKIKETNNHEVDLIINTGDFINVGKIENYSHAKKVLDYVINKFGVTSKSVAVTIGNHDFKMKEQCSLEEKRKPFVEFSSDYAPGHFIAQTEIAKLYHNQEKKTQILIIDNASREDDVNEPVTTTVKELDAIVKLIRDHNLEKDLIVVSHYPVLLFPLAKYPVEDKDWSKNHVWQTGYNLQDRLSPIKTQGSIIYLCGDGHIPDAFQNGNSKFIMTGMLGGNYANRNHNSKSFHLQIQARIYDTQAPTDLWTYNYKPKGFDFDVANGIWEEEKSPLRIVVNDHKKTDQEKSKSRTTILSEPLEKEIINRIKKEKLYSLGRYVTSPEYNSLSWVSINRLFEEQQLMVSLIDKGVDWLKQIIKDPSKALLIGVDFSGAIIATHLAIRTGITHTCFADHSPFHEESSYISEITRKISTLGNLKDIVIVTDVIASGHSLLKLISEMEEILTNQLGVTTDFHYHSISVISDQTIIREEFDHKIKTIKTACGSLKMPIVKNNALPDIDTLSCRIDFTE